MTNKASNLLIWVLLGLLAGTILTSVLVQNKLKDKIIELQNQDPVIEYVEVRDTITVEKPVVQWKTKYSKDTIVTLDTLSLNDTIIILKEVESVPDTFSSISRCIDSNLDATITIQGRGVYEKTFIDSVSLDYRYIKEELKPKKKCSWWRRFWCGCD